MNEISTFNQSQLDIYNNRLMGYSNNLKMPFKMVNDLIIIGCDESCNLYLLKFYAGYCYNFDIYNNVTSVDGINKIFYIDFGSIKNNITQVTNNDSLFTIPFYIKINFKFSQFERNTELVNLVNSGKTLLFNSNGELSNNIDIFDESYFTNDPFYQEAKRIIEQQLYSSGLNASKSYKTFKCNESFLVRERTGYVHFEKDKVYKILCISNISVVPMDKDGKRYMPINMIRYKSLFDKLVEVDELTLDEIKVKVIE